MKIQRDEALSLLVEALHAGARLRVVCDELGLDPRTIQRWRKSSKQDDQRKGPTSLPANALDEKERAHVLEVVNSREFRDLPPKQIVPRLADQGRYLASESTIYRLLKQQGQNAHRGAAQPRIHHKPQEVVACNPNELWSWDITYLPSQVKGQFYYLYLFVDVWSRRIVKAVVHQRESSDLAAIALEQAYLEHGVRPHTITLHSDNGSPMKGATFLATMQALGVVPSFSRPGVSDDNPFSEALFRTLKYAPAYPHRPFASVDAAAAWVERFVHWYNHQHRHSAIGFVTPAQRHAGSDIAILFKRRAVYLRAREQHPARWSRSTRRWDAPALVALNPRDLSTKARAESALRCGAHSTTSTVPPQHAPHTSTAPRHLGSKAA
jgi:transposase InsO family protein